MGMDTFVKKVVDDSHEAAWAYLQSPVQLFVAVLIAGNFVANIVEKWIDPSAEQYPQTWEAIDSFFNSVFAIELVWNMSLG